MFHLRHTYHLIRAFVAIFVIILSCGVAHSRVADPKEANPEAYNQFLKYWRNNVKMNVIRITESPFYEKLDSIIELCKKKYPNYRWKKRTHFTWHAEYIESHKNVDTLDCKHINMLEPVSEPIVIAVSAMYDQTWDNAVIYKDKKYYFNDINNTWKYYRKRYKSTRKTISYLCKTSLIDLTIIILYKPSGTISIKDVYYGIDDIGGLFTPEELK